MTWQEWFDAAVAWLRSINTGSSGGSGGSGSSVPELSLTAGPIAVTVIICIIAIALERRRLQNINKI